MIYNLTGIRRELLVFNLELPVQPADPEQLGSSGGP
jgi:hypothetical protein